MINEIPLEPLFAGQWEVIEATLPNGSFAYTGTLTVQRQGALFGLEWNISAGRYVGLGLTLGEHLLVSCGEQVAGLGLALLQPEADGQISIQWCAGGVADTAGHGTFVNSWTGTFEGEHEVVQYLPDGRLYGEWLLSIRRVGQIYELAWRKGEAVHWQGLGLDTPGGLAAAWYPDPRQLALLDYKLDLLDPECLTAVWTLGGFTGLGTETLRRLPPR